MKQFDLAGYTSVLNRLYQGQNTCLSLHSSGNTQFDLAHFIELADYVTRYCVKVGFEHGMAKGFTLVERLKKLPWDIDASSLRADLRNLEDDIGIDMCFHKFVHIKKDLADFFGKTDAFGTDVSAAFPSAMFDVGEAGDCIAAGAGTAAVFHLMRAVECGLRAFARRLGLLRVVRDKKRGKTVPLSYAQWEQILQQLPEKIDMKVAAMRPGRKKQAAQEFYYSALHELSGFKDAWRNHVMHTRRRYSSEDAVAIHSHVGRFLKSLAAYGIHGENNAQKS